MYKREDQYSRVFCLAKGVKYKKKEQKKERNISMFRVLHPVSWLICVRRKRSPDSTQERPGHEHLVERNSILIHLFWLIYRSNRAELRRKTKKETRWHLCSDYVLYHTCNASSTFDIFTQEFGWYDHLARQAR